MKSRDEIKEYQKSWWRKNKDKLQERNFRLKKRIRDWFEGEVKIGLKCEKCDENHPGVLDFHHKDPSKKTTTVSFLVSRNASKARILEEIDKCQVLCSNCHRKLHWEEDDFIWREREAKYQQMSSLLKKEYICVICGCSKEQKQIWKSKFRCMDCYRAIQKERMRLIKQKRREEKQSRL